MLDHHRRRGALVAPGHVPGPSGQGSAGVAHAPHEHLGRPVERQRGGGGEAREDLLGLVADKTLSGSLAKQVFEIMLETGEGAAKIVDERGLKQTSDTGAIDAEIDKILAANADKVQQYKDGKEALFGFFVGQTMKAMAGKANPGVVNERLKAKLG